MAKLMNRWTIVVALLALPGAPAAAQRVLEVDNASTWEHPHSGISVPPELGGLPRTRVTEFVPDHLNLGFSFGAEAGADELTLYIYRDTNGAVPVWFEQARRSIEARDIYAGPQLVYDIAPYEWPGQQGWVGLRAFYDTPKSAQASSTGLVLFSIDGWYVKLRATSATRSAANLSLWVDAALREMGLPAPRRAQPDRSLSRSVPRSSRSRRRPRMPGSMEPPACLMPCLGIWLSML